MPVLFKNDLVIFNNKEKGRAKNEKKVKEGVIMQKTWKRIVTIVMAFVMIVSSFSYNVYAEVKKDYVIYPTPQQMTYGQNAVTLTKDVNVVYGAVDQYTKDHLTDVLGILKMNPTVTDAKVSGKTNVLVGIYGSQDEADKYLAAEQGDFAKTDSYILSIKDDVIAILGKDTDAAFHGITTLKHIFNQVTADQVTELTIKDYADIKGRGFIEGYYGNPWSDEDRADLMTFGGDYKLNQYIYAPKDDPKHNAKWRELYTAEELADIAALAEAGNKSKCYYVYALHTFMHNAVRFDTDANYKEDLGIIEKKFEQLMGAGVKQFAILADDAGVPQNKPENYVKLMKDLTDWMILQQKKVEGLKADILFCPNDYMGWGDSAQMQALKALPESVSIIQTGGQIWGEVGPSFNDAFYNNMGRPAYMWINWPCSDNTKDGLIMGGAEKVLKPGVNPDVVDGIVLNPMQQSEPSKAGLFTNADYAWNVWDAAEKYDQVWHDSFNYMDHGTLEDTVGSVALRELSKHMLNSTQLHNEESVELKDRMIQFNKDLEAGKSIEAQANDLKAEFLKLQKAAVDYRTNTGNTRTLGQIVYWIDCWDDTTAAILSYLDAAIAIEKGEATDVIWDQFAAGQANFEKSRTHGFLYIDHQEYAKVGRRYLTPFMNKLDQILSAKVSALIDPNKQIVTYITNRNDTPEGKIDNVLDNNPSTQIIYKNPTTIEAGTYVGMTYTKPIDINKVIFRMGQSGNQNDTFSKAQLEYTEDGKTWKPASDTIYAPASNVEADLALKNVKGIRLTATETITNKWLGVKDIVVNPVEEVTPGPDAGTGTTTVTLDNVAVKGGSTNDIIDSNMGSFAHLAEKNYKQEEYKDYIPLNGAVVLNFSQPKTLDTIHMKQDSGTDKLTGYAIEYSENGTDGWTTLKEYAGDAEVTLKVPGTVTAKAVRVRNTKLNVQSNKNGYWWKLYDFSVTEKTGETPQGDKLHVYANVDAPVTSVYEEAKCQLMSQGNVTLAKDQYVGLDLGRIKDISKITAATSNNADVKLQVSENGLDWVDVADPANVPDARYIRYINVNDAPVEFALTSFVVESNEVTAPFLKESNVGINSSWGVGEDSRNNGAAFDGNVDTTTEFADFPQKDQFIIYDLGQDRNISKLELYAQDSAVNYIRDAEISISQDGTAWTKVVTIGDGVENKDDGGTKCIDSDAGYQASSKYPNKVTVSGTVAAQPARYIKIQMTAPNNSRAVLFNEIMINDGEYAPAINDPTFQATVVEKQGHAPQNMTDGDLTTSYVPDTKEAGSITYTLSQDLDVNRINLVQKGNSGAKLSLYVEKDGKREWVDAGILDKSLNSIFSNYDYILKMKVDWEAGKAPNISEIITFKDAKLPDVRAQLDTYLAEVKDTALDGYTKESADEFTKKLAAAQAVSADNLSSDKAMKQAEDELRVAFGNLKTKGSTAALQDKLDEIAKLTEKDYTPESWTELQKVVAEANELVKQPNADAQNIQAMIERLDAAKAALVSVVEKDKEALQKYIDDNKLEELDTTLYVSKTVTPFQEALKAAKDVLAKADATSEEIKAASDALQKARTELVLKAHADELNALKAKADTYREEDYTAESWTEFKNTLDTVYAAIDANDSSSEDVKALTASLEEAAAKLAKRVDTSELQNQIEALKNIKAEDYTTDSYNALMAAVKKAEAALEAGEMTKAEVQDMINVLADAKANLVPVTPVPTTTPVPTQVPTTPVPTTEPTQVPTTPAPTTEPTQVPTVAPTTVPTVRPTAVPTQRPVVPTQRPVVPTQKPQVRPSNGGNVATGDETQVFAWSAFAILGLSGIVLGMKKKRNFK